MSACHFCAQFTISSTPISTMLQFRMHVLCFVLNNTCGFYSMHCITACRSHWKSTLGKWLWTKGRVSGVGWLAGEGEVLLSKDFLLQSLFLSCDETGVTKLVILFSLLWRTLEEALCNPLTNPNIEPLWNPLTTPWRAHTSSLYCTYFSPTMPDGPSHFLFVNMCFLSSVSSLASFLAASSTVNVKQRVQC